MLTNLNALGMDNARTKGKQDLSCKIESDVFSHTSEQTRFPARKDAKNMASFTRICKPNFLD